MTKLNAQTGGTDPDGGTAQPPATSGILSGFGPNGQSPEVKDFGALARRQAREADSRNNTYGESDPSSGGTQALTRTPDPESLRMKNSRLLTEAEKDMLRKRNSIAGTVDLDQIRVHEDERDLPFYMPSWASGMTQENHIYLRNGRYNLSDQTTHKLLAEEVQHVQQYQNGMTRAGYLLEGAKKGYDKSMYEEEGARAKKLGPIPSNSLSQ